MCVLHLIFLGITLIFIFFIHLSFCFISTIFLFFLFFTPTFPLLLVLESPSFLSFPPHQSPQPPLKTLSAIARAPPACWYVGAPRL